MPVDHNQRINASSVLSHSLYGNFSYFMAKNRSSNKRLNQNIKLTTRVFNKGKIQGKMLNLPECRPKGLKML